MQNANQPAMSLKYERRVLTLAKPSSHAAIERRTGSAAVARSPSRGTSTSPPLLSSPPWSSKQHDNVQALRGQPRRRGQQLLPRAHRAAGPPNPEAPHWPRRDGGGGERPAAQPALRAILRVDPSSGRGG